VTKDPREVGPLSRGVISPDDSTPIRPVTGRRSLFPSSSTRRPIGDHLAVGLPRRENDGLTTFHGWITDGAGSASSPVARQRRQGKGEDPCTWPHTVWFKPISAFGLSVLTTFISSSPELALPSTLAPDRFGVRSRRIPSREVRPPRWGEVTLSQELRTAGLLRPRVLVGYRWSHTGLCPDRTVITGTSIASCRTPHRSGRAHIAHPVPHLRTSLRGSAGRGPRGPWGDRNVSPDARNRATRVDPPGYAGTATVSRFSARPPGSSGGWRSCR
jgi:hypothetical protein